MGAPLKCKWRWGDVDDFHAEWFCVCGLGIHSLFSSSQSRSRVAWLLRKDRCEITINRIHGRLIDRALRSAIRLDSI